MERARRLVHHSLSLFEAARAPHGRHTNQLFGRAFEGLQQQVRAALEDTNAPEISSTSAGGLRNGATDDPDSAADPMPLLHAPRKLPELDRIERRLIEGTNLSAGRNHLSASDVAWMGAIIYEMRQIFSASVAAPGGR